MALDDVCKSLRVPAYDQSAKEVIAARIIELARRGERNAERLKERVLQEAQFNDAPNVIPLAPWYGNIRG